MSEYKGTHYVDQSKVVPAEAVLAAALANILDICGNEYSAPEGGSTAWVSRDVVRKIAEDALKWTTDPTYEWGVRTKWGTHAEGSEVAAIGRRFAHQMNREEATLVKRVKASEPGEWEDVK